MVTLLTPHHVLQYCLRNSCGDFRKGSFSNVKRLLVCKQSLLSISDYFMIWKDTIRILRSKQNQCLLSTDYWTLEEARILANSNNEPSNLTKFFKKNFYSLHGKRKKFNSGLSSPDDRAEAREVFILPHPHVLSYSCFSDFTLFLT